MKVNCYQTEFFAFCPLNNIRIKYQLKIETESMLDVADLIDEVTLCTRGLHEDLADDLFKSFGGKQTLTAFHHGVLIETVRS